MYPAVSDAAVAATGAVMESPRRRAGGACSLYLHTERSLSRKHNKEYPCFSYYTRARCSGCYRDPRPYRSENVVNDWSTPVAGVAVDFPCFYSVYIFPRRSRYTHAFTHDTHKNIYNFALLLLQCTPGQEFMTLRRFPRILGLSSLGGTGKMIAGALCVLGHMGKL